MVREGQIVEQGSHADLIARPQGAYATLVGLQMSALGAKQADGQEDVLEDEMVSLRSTGSYSSPLDMGIDQNALSPQQYFVLICDLDPFPPLRTISSARSNRIAQAWRIISMFAATLKAVCGAATKLQQAFQGRLLLRVETDGIQHLISFPDGNYG